MARAAVWEDRIERALGELYRTLGRNRATRLPWAMIRTFSRAEGTMLSGSIAYFTFLSLLPLLMLAGFAIATISGFDAGIRTALAGALERIFPRGRDILNELVRARVAVGVLGLITITYAGTGFVGALAGGLNRMWEVPSSRRNPVGQKLLNGLVVLLLAVVLLGSVGVTVWAGYLAEAALGREARPVVGVIERLASPASLFLVFLMLYRLLPARPLTWRSQVAGAALGAVGVEVLKWGFAVWARQSAGLALLPRSLGSVVLLLVWLGLFSQLVLYGAALNVVMDRRRRGLPFLPGDEPSAPGSGTGPAPASVRSGVLR
jgi:membrane protein